MEANAGLYDPMLGSVQANLPMRLNWPAGLVGSCAPGHELITTLRTSSLKMQPPCRPCRAPQQTSAMPASAAAPVPRLELAEANGDAPVERKKNLSKLGRQLSGSFKGIKVRRAPARPLALKAARAQAVWPSEPTAARHAPRRHTVRLTPPGSPSRPARRPPPAEAHDPALLPEQPQGRAQARGALGPRQGQRRGGGGSGGGGLLRAPGGPRRGSAGPRPAAPQAGGRAGGEAGAGSGHHPGRAGARARAGRGGARARGVCASVPSALSALLGFVVRGVLRIFHSKRQIEPGRPAAAHRRCSGHPSPDLRCPLPCHT